MNVTITVWMRITVWMQVRFGCGLGSGLGPGLAVPAATFLTQVWRAAVASREKRRALCPPL